MTMITLRHHDLGANCKWCKLKQQCRARTLNSRISHVFRCRLSVVTSQFVYTASIWSDYCADSPTVFNVHHGLP